MVIDALAIASYEAAASSFGGAYANVGSRSQVYFSVLGVCSKFKTPVGTLAALLIPQSEKVDKILKDKGQTWSYNRLMILWTSPSFCKDLRNL